MVAPRSTSSFKGRVAVVQAEPAWLDLAASVEKTCKLIDEAAANGAQLLAFPECFIPGYPTWIWSRPVDFDLTSRYIKNSLRRDSPEMEAIQACVARNQLTVSLGMSENDNNSLYIAQCTIGPDGEIQMWRRKLKPTHMERTIFGDASGSSLLNVVDTPIGRVGALSCWEHVQPLLKYHTLHQHEEVHVAAWPPVFPHGGGPGLWSMSREGCRGLSQTYAIESQTFVLHSTALQSQRAVELLGTGASPLFGRPGGGSSAIFGPDGRQLSKDVDETKETIIYADLDENQILSNKGFVDCVGHYSRPDLLWLGVDTQEKSHVVVGARRQK